MSLIKEAIKMKTIKKYSLLLLFLLFFSYGVKAQEPPSSEDYNYNTFEAQKKWIVGTFVSDDDSKWKMQFTKDGRCINSYIGSTTDHYTYKIEYSTQKANTPSGHINVYTLYLKAIPADPNEDLTYEMYIDDTGLELDPVPMGILRRPFSFSRVKPKEFTSSKTLSKEEEKESELSPQKEERSDTLKKYPFLELTPIPAQTRLEAYQAGEYDCENGNSWGTSLRNKQYEMDYDYGWGKAGCPVR